MPRHAATGRQTSSSPDWACSRICLPAGLRRWPRASSRFHSTVRELPALGRAQASAALSLPLPVPPLGAPPSPPPAPPRITSSILSWLVFLRFLCTRAGPFLSDAPPSQGFPWLNP